MELPSDKPAGMAGDVLTAKKSQFLKALAETRIVASAARIAGLDSARLYRLRRRDPNFAAAWDVVLNRHPAPKPAKPTPKRGQAAKVRRAAGAYEDRPVELVLRVYRPAGRPMDDPIVTAPPRKSRRSNHKPRQTTPEPTDDPAPAALTDDERADRIARLLDAARARRTGPAASD